MLRIADHIENFDEEHPEDGLYQRAVVPAVVDTSGEVVFAYIYHQTGKCQTTKLIQSGDWLHRT